MYICHSGGALGADITWENEGYKYGVKTIAYSFYGHKQFSKSQKILSEAEIDSGYSHVLIAEKTLKRGLNYRVYPYLKNLLSRNWYQVKNSEVIFAIGMFTNKKRNIVNGGTGWAVQMSIDNNKPVYLYEQNLKTWNKFNYNNMVFEEIDYIPKLTENFAGIGTRDINNDGINAIKNVYMSNSIYLL